MKYTLVAAGGTFDRLHQGHKDFLKFILSLGKDIVIGLTSDQYIEKNKKDVGVQPFEIRRKELEKYLSSINRTTKVEILPIDDEFGPTLSKDYPFDCLAVTSETEHTGIEINKKREEQGLSQLKIEVFRTKVLQNGEPISSTRIRTEILRLPPALRVLLQEPWGEILDTVPRNFDQEKAIAVGDVTTFNFQEQGIFCKLSIVDNKTGRTDKTYDLNNFHGEIEHVDNPASTITPELFLTILKALNQDKKTMIVIDGEEDLAVLPAIYAAPVGFKIFYGQPQRGLVEVVVTEEIKNKAKSVIDKFELLD